MTHIYAWQWLVASGAALGFFSAAPFAFVAGWLAARRSTALRLRGRS